MAESFKFIHASDFHLDEPISGLVELPLHLKTKLANAPYHAAKNIFDLAVAERVDFILLSGDLLDLAHCGSRPVAFLLSQFERLGEKGIEVYWCSGNTDPIDRWPTNIDLPDNVRTFSTAVLEDITHSRNGVSIANIYGIGNSANRQAIEEFRSDSADVFPILIGFGEFDTSHTPYEEFRYWALGGRHRTSKVDNPSSMICYSGTPQGRSVNESGPFGCHLCRVDTAGKMRVQFVETDTVRWLPQKISIGESISEKELQETLTERGLKIITDLGERLALVSWNLVPAGDFQPQLRQRDFVSRMLEWLRDEFGRGERGFWSTQITIDPPGTIPTSWYEEDTILGEYLRAIGRYQSDETLNISLHEYLPATDDNDVHSAIARVVGDRRAVVLRQAALAGIEYLGAANERFSRQLEPTGKKT